MPRARPSAPSPELWESYLQAELDCDVRVVFTRARKMPIRVRPVRGWTARVRAGKPPRSALEVRMHRFFDGAPAEVQKAVASWIRSGERAPRACRILDAWIENGLRSTPPPERRASRLATRGAAHDLAQQLEVLLSGEFAHDRALHARPPALTWGRRAPSRSRGSLRLGSYDADTHVVRLHPVLDQPAIPEWVVRYVVFHECLHALHPPRRDAEGRWVHHGPEFRAREKLYADFERVLAWEKQNLRALVRSARSGLPLQAPRAAARALPRLVEQPLRFLQSLLFAD